MHGALNISDSFIEEGGVPSVCSLVWQTSLVDCGGNDCDVEATCTVRVSQ